MQTSGGDLWTQEGRRDVVFTLVLVIYISLQFCDYYRQLIRLIVCTEYEKAKPLF